MLPAIVSWKVPASYFYSASLEWRLDMDKSLFNWQIYIYGYFILWRNRSWNYCLLVIILLYQ